jgi:hypothetical protein
MARLHHIPFASILLVGLTLLAAVAPWGRHVHGAIPVGCAELIQNGGFEDGEVGWQQASAGGYDLISDFNPRTGSLGAYLAGVNNADDRLSQQVNLPAGTITLSAWWSLDTTEAAGAFDQMTVSLLRPDGSWLADLLSVDDTASASVWDEIVIDLSSYAGQTVTLRFTATTDDTNPSDFYLDDISVVACAASPALWRTYLPITIR